MIRRTAWFVGAPIRALEIGLIRSYRATLSGWLGGQCRFYPTCSHYAEDAIRECGALRGTVMAAWRILRCNPFGKGGIDHVRPDRQYDDVTHTVHRPSTHEAEV
jgi:uncharacterized protein